MILNSVSAQFSTSKNGLAFRVANSNYLLPIVNELNSSDFGGLGLEVEYYRHLNDFLNLSIPARIGKTNLPADGIGNFQTVPTLGLDLLLQLKYAKPTSFFYPYFYSGLRTVSEDLGGDFSFSIPIGLALNFKFHNNSYISLKSDYGFGFQENRNHLQVAAGVMILFGNKTQPEETVDNDRDKDGIPNSEDRCPDIPGIAGLFGCPDRDNDGLADSEDECPDEAGPMHNKGCPVAADQDRDGIPDHLDDCPEKTGEASANGCPDRDGDGLEDKKDNCPDNAGPENLGGCPDSDNDGVLDKIDRCPNQAGPVRNNGCPYLTIDDKNTLKKAAQTIKFETGTAKLTSNSYPILDKIADILNRNPAHKLAISGHTDSIGSREDNQTLSENRAKACHDYLISRGINPVRLGYKGYGETVPLADNKFKEGRDQNRRIEFNLYIE